LRSIGKDAFPLSPDWPPLSYSAVAAAGCSSSADWTGATFEDVAPAGAGAGSSGTPPDSATLAICAECVAGIFSAIASGPAFGTVRSETESDHAPTSRAIEWVTGESFTNRTVFAAPKATPIATPAATTTIAAITTGIFCLGGGDSGGEDCRFEIGTAASRLARYKASYSVKSMNKPPVDSLNVRL